MRPALLTLLLTALTACPGYAQPYGTDWIVGHIDGTLVRMNSGGIRSTIGRYPDLMWDVTMDVGNTHYVAGQRFNIIRIDRQTSAATTLGPTVIQPYDIAIDQNGDYVLGPVIFGTTASILRMSRGGLLQTVATNLLGTPVIAQDLLSGDWIVGEDANTLLRYSHDWSTTLTTVRYAQTYSFRLSMDPHFPYMYIASQWNLKLDTRSNQITTLNNLGGSGPTSVLGLTTDRSPMGSGAILHHGGGNLLTQFDRLGAPISSTQTTIAAQISALVHDQSRNLGAVRTNAPNNRILHVSFPTAALRPYIVAFSLAGYTPGVPLGGGRVVPLNPDALTALTVAQSLPPLVSNNIGLLDASGSAQVQMNLNTLGRAISGVRVWAVAVALDSAAPNGISHVSKPMIFVL